MSFFHRRVLVAAAVIVGLLTADIAASQPTAASASDAEDRGRGEQLKRIFGEVASGYQVTAGKDPNRLELLLRDQPIMHWLSLEGATGTYMGSVFVWTHLRRPEVVGTFFTSDVTKEQLSICEDLYSFAHRQVSVRSSQDQLWRPTPHRAMQIIPGSPVPAATAAGRRLQLRAMAKQFSGRMNRRGVSHQLRLLPRPVYEYEGEGHGVLTGALLVLVAYTTDPDILVLVESRQTGEGPKWFFQPARFSDKSLWLAYRSNDVWTSLRTGHGTDEPNATDGQYHVNYVTVEAPRVSNGKASITTP